MILLFSILGAKINLIGADEQGRTAYLFLTKEVLYLLSYISITVSYSTIIFMGVSIILLFSKIFI